MGTAVLGRVCVGVALVLGLGAGCSAGSDQPEPAPGPAPVPAPAPAPSSSQGERSGSALPRLSERAGSAAELIASGDGLRVVNRSGGDVWLVFPDEDRVQVEASRHVVVHRPCRQMLPLRAVTAEDEVQVHRGPCRQRDTWVID